MLRSMYSGISGLKGFQTKLDVVANNIANVNTFGFKKSRATFQDMMSQQIAGAAAASQVRGGVNPRQVGLGSMVGSIDAIHTTGNLANTGRDLDMAINGDGFFTVAQVKLDDTGAPRMVANPSLEEADSNQVPTDNIAETLDIRFTRAGNFFLDKNGFVVNPSGQYLIGKSAVKTVLTDPTATWTLSEKAGFIQIPKEAKSFSISANGTVTFLDPDNKLHTAGQLLLAKFENPSGLQRVGENQFIETTNSGSLIKDPAAGVTVGSFAIPGQNGSGGITVAMLEMSNVDLSDEFTEMIVAQRAFQSNSRSVTTSDQILEELLNLKR